MTVAQCCRDLLHCPQSSGKKAKVPSPPVKKSFYIGEEVEGEEETDGSVDSGDSDEDLFDHFGPARLSPPPEEEEEDVDGPISV